MSSDLAESALGGACRAKMAPIGSVVGVGAVPHVEHDLRGRRVGEPVTFRPLRVRTLTLPSQSRSSAPVSGTLPADGHVEGVLQEGEGEDDLPGAVASAQRVVRPGVIQDGTVAPVASSARDELSQGERQRPDPHLVDLGAPHP